MVIGLMITEQCNFTCAHCMVNSTNTYSCVSDEIVNKYLKMLETISPDRVNLLGGEPFLHIDIVEKIVNLTLPYCRNIYVYSNGSFLLNNELTNRIKKLEINVRISDDRFHREFWSDKLKNLIEGSKYWIAKVNDNTNMIPVGRAYEEFKHLKLSLGCSLLSGYYGKKYPKHHRCMIMLNGDVNLYCYTLEGALANVFEDDNITYELLIKREKVLHNFLIRNVIKFKSDTYMAVMCNKCSKYKVTEKNILYDGVVVANTHDYL